MPGPPPAFPTKTLPGMAAPTTPTVNHIPQRRIDELELPFIADNPTPPSAVTLDPYAGFKRKPDLMLETAGQQEQDMLFYHNFGSPVFLPGTENIERLGGALVEPHPLPVPLIDDVIVPPFRPINPTLAGMDKLQFNIDGSNERFEHLGGGVIAKKQDNVSQVEGKLDVQAMESSTAKTAASSTTTTTPLKVDKATEIPVAPQPTENSALADSIGEFFMELLNLPKEGNASSTPEPEPIESRIEPEEVELELDSMLTTTGKPKPNFMNLKELILQRNSPTPAETSSSSTSSSTTTTTTMKTTTRSSTTTTTTTPATTTTKRNRIRPGNERPTMLDDSNLFPSHSKWEFVNSSAPLNSGYGVNMRKVFNKTLQAWVSEDVEKTENFTLHDIKTRINNASNIQDISLIFDTLASKLGITPSVPTKLPPFSHHKLKQRNETKVKLISTTSTTELPVLESSVKNFIELPLQQREPFIKPMSSFVEDGGSAEVLGAAIPVVGEAEVEVIDPIKYEELLKTSQFADSIPTTEASPHHLVTLLPVRSNSGIRTYKPAAEDFEYESQRSQSEIIPSEIIPPVSSKPKAQSTIRRKSNVNQSRRFAQPPAEAVVKGGIKVTVKK